MSASSLLSTMSKDRDRHSLFPVHPEATIASPQTLHNARGHFEWPVDEGRAASCKQDIENKSAMMKREKEKRRFSFSFLWSF